MLKLPIDKLVVRDLITLDERPPFYSLVINNVLLYLLQNVTFLLAYSSISGRGTGAAPQLKANTELNHRFLHRSHSLTSVAQISR